MRKWVMLTGVTLAALAGPAPKLLAEDSVPVVRGEVIRDFARITFEWPRSTYLNAELHGRILTVNFDRGAHPDLKPLLHELSPYISRAETEPDGHTLLFLLRGNYRIRSFVSGSINGVDLLKPGSIEAEPTLEEAEETAPVPERRHALRRRHEAAKAAPAQKTAPPKEQAAAAPPSPREAPVSKPLPAAAAALDKSLAEQLARLAPAAGKPVAPPAVPSPDNNDDNTLRIFASSAPDGTLLRFPWRRRVAAAVFNHSGYLWVVFNAPVTLDLGAIKETMPDLRALMQTFTTDKATVLRIDHGESAGVNKAADAFEWQVTLGVSEPPPERLRVDTSTAPPLPPYVFVPITEAAEPLRLKDPDLGDALIVTPDYEPGQGIYPERDFIEFTLPASQEGVVVAPIADDTLVEPLLKGLRITTRHGVTLSSNLPRPPDIDLSAKNGPALATLFPGDEWRGKDSRPFLKRMQELQIAIAAASSDEASLPLRVKLAELYLNEGMAVEAHGVLEEIRRIDPAYFTSNRLSALLGAADFLMYRFADAAQEFAAPELMPVPEIRYWRAMTAELLGSPGQNYDYLRNYDPYIRHYPYLFRQRLAIVAADRAISARDYGAAVRILDTLKKDPKLTEGISDYITFLNAEIEAGTGKLQDAMAEWQDLAENADPFVRARAQLALIDQEIKNGTLKPKEAIAALEQLRLSWRGDALELEVLTMLGDLYQTEKDDVDALSAWRDIRTAFPNTPQASDALPKMTAAFIDLFDHGAAKALPMLEQIALYYDYRDLTPSDATGDRIVEGLADKLAAMDLLDQAIIVLDQRMRYDYEKVARSRVGAKLAKLYLMDRRPDKALSALDQSMYGDNPEDLRTERDYLAAKALLDLGQYPAAMTLVANDKAPPAEDIRLSAYWRQKDWKGVTATAEDMLKKRKVPTAPVTPREADALVELALAYTFDHEQDQLRYLRDYFDPLMADSPRKALFEFLTREDVPVTPDRFNDLLKDFDATRDFLRHFQVVPQEEIDALNAKEAAAPNDAPETASSSTSTSTSTSTSSTSSSGSSSSTSSSGAASSSSGAGAPAASSSSGSSSSSSSGGKP